MDRKESEREKRKKITKLIKINEKLFLKLAFFFLCSRSRYFFLINEKLFYGIATTICFILTVHVKHHLFTNWWWNAVARYAHVRSHFAPRYFRQSKCIAHDIWLCNEGKYFMSMKLKKNYAIEIIWGNLGRYLCNFFASWKYSCLRKFETEFKLKTRTIDDAGIKWSW